MSGFPNHHEDSYTLRVTMISCIPRTGILSMELYKAIKREFGECGLRRFMKNLSMLVGWGCILKTEEVGGPGGVIRTYFRGGAEVPMNRGSWCKVCQVLYGSKIPRWMCERRDKPWDKVPLLAFPVPPSRVHSKAAGR